jgi:multicomponent K+:H+ antiporter subunit F
MSFATELLNISLVIAFVAVAISQIMAMARLIVGPSVGIRWW